MLTDAKITGLSKAAGLEWLASHNYKKPYHEGFPFCDYVKTPIQSGGKSGLIKSILTWLPSDGHCVLSITDWEINPTCENWDLFDRVRWSLGEKRPINEAPSQLIGLSDRGPLESLLDLCIYSLWDAILADDTHRFLIQFSNDELVTIACDDSLAPDAKHTIELYMKDG